MNRSADEVAEVPPGVVTVTSAVPAVPLGEVTVQVVVELQPTEVAGVSPNVAEVVDVPGMKPVPVTVTGVPPTSGPAAGVMAVTVGTGS